MVIRSAALAASGALECKKMASSEQINKTTYYQLPCGKFLEDFIYAKGLNFNMGSAVKYKWRAGNKDGESETKDLMKADHYIRFEAQCRGCSLQVVADEVDALLKEARIWEG